MNTTRPALSLGAMMTTDAVSLLEMQKVEDVSEWWYGTENVKVVFFEVAQVTMETAGAGLGASHSDNMRGSEAAKLKGRVWYMVLCSNKLRYHYVLCIA